VSAATRLAVLEALEQVVAERDQKRRKTTLQFVREDLRKKLRRTHPELPNDLLRGILDGLLTAGELIHRDGAAIRSTTAPFTLQKDATGLNESLARLYLGMLREAGTDLSDSGALAELLYGDADRRRQVEETIAWLVTDGERTADLDLDLDDLLSVSGSAPAASEPAPAPRAEPAPSRRAEPAEEAPLDLDSVLEPVSAPEGGDEPRKRRRTRKKSEEAEPVAKSSGRGRRKAEPEVAAASELDLDLDALLEPQPKD
jgi:hypothetical protein